MQNWFGDLSPPGERRRHVLLDLPQHPMKTSPSHIDRSWPDELLKYLLFVAGILFVIATLIVGGN
jgi:hypothetical protein